MVRSSMVRGAILAVALALIVALPVEAAGARVIEAAGVALSKPDSAEADDEAGPR